MNEFIKKEDSSLGKKREKKEEKPTFYVYIICCGVAILIFVIIIMMMLNKKAIDLKSNNFKINTGELSGSGKKNCSTVKTYCFTDDDCHQQCVSSSMHCVHGICRNNLNAISAKNECDPSKGVIGYLVGNTTLGTYEYICKSVDPAIAISVNENRMCYGDSSYKIDYLSVYPSKYSCTCNNQITIPATSQKREHVECNSVYADLAS
ncbi:PIF-3 [Callinectes sapidus nudivirus]|nr:PIF-3 [Callinectes sapidus nudivirus]